jgi:hypothetical protein
LRSALYQSALPVVIASDPVDSVDPFDRWRELGARSSVSDDLIIGHVEEKPQIWGRNLDAC